MADLTVTSEVADAVSQPAQGDNDATAVNPPPAAVVIKEVAGHTGLYVPMMYVGYIDNSGKYERYQCDDSNGKELKIWGTITTAKRKAVTDGLSSCVSITIISGSATLKTHIPPYLCPIIKGDKEDKEKEQQLKNLKAALKAAIKDHKAALQKATTVVVAGPESKEDEVETILRKLLDADSSFVRYKLDMKLDPHRNDRSTVVDLTVSPPKFYIEGHEVPYKKG